jgi:hypothetical protein
MHESVRIKINPGLKVGGLKMNCRRVSSLISAYIDGELTGVEMLEIRDHLKSCRSCTLQYESLRYTKQLLSHLAYAQPRVGLAQRICSQLEVVHVPAYQRFLNRVLSLSRSRLTPVAVGCAAIGAVLVVLVSSPVTESNLTSLPKQNSYVSSDQLPYYEITPSMTEISYHPAETQPLIPQPLPEDKSESNIFSLASFGGR